MKVAILNLMPLKEETEADFKRVFASTGMSVELLWMKLSTHTPKHASAEHMALYMTFDEVRQANIDGLIITGAPVEHLEFEEVTYWDELTKIFTWANQNLHSTLYICWAAQAGLYYHYGIPKYGLPKKMFGIFPQHIAKPIPAILKDMREGFMMPHSRHTEIREEDVVRHQELRIIASSPVNGVSMVMDEKGRAYYITGHMEYASWTLDKEYHRDLGKRDDVDVPLNYYLDNDIEKQPVWSWQNDVKQLYINWINELRDKE